MQWSSVSKEGVMKLALVLVGVLAALVLAASAFSSRSASAGPAQLGAPPKVLVPYGHIRSLTRKGTHYELRFDPALWLSGTTANRAAIEDGVIPPGDTVPNDYYVRDEGRRVLTYRVPAGAKATVITNTPAQGLRSTRVSVSELAQIVKRKNPKGRALFDRRNQLGYWIRVTLDTVRSLDQQYQP
jgi:hypothetical protein